MKHVCNRCNEGITRGFVIPVTIGKEKYQLCEECAAEIENSILNMPKLQFGDEDLEVK